MKKPLTILPLLLLFILAVHRLPAQQVWAEEEINQSIPTPVDRYRLSHPFEISYGPDDSLYITEKVGRVVQVSAITGKRRIILDYRANVNSGVTATSIAQRGMMGLALDKNFKNGNYYIYVAYSNNASNVRISRFTYTPGGNLGSEQILITGIPAGSDHSSGRLVYGPDDKLYYTCGDLGNNQFNNRCTQIRSQDLPTSAEVSGANYAKYSGKTLRLNLDGSIPSDNPLLDPDGAGGQAAVRSHIFTLGHRNPQGLAFETNTNLGNTYPVLKPSGILYSSEHGVRTDDEINILSSGNNYGWPYWSGYRNATPENYHYINWSTSGSCGSTGYNEVTIPAGADVIEENEFPAGSFTEPIFSMYAKCNGASNCNTTLTSGTDWMEFPTIAPSSIDYYGFTYIPGWYKSLIIPTLRRGTLYRYKLNAAGNGVTGDSLPLFRRYDRFRDLATKNGNIFFVVTDSVGDTSGPSGSGTSTLTARGAIMKYTFRGYQDVGGKSSLPTSIGVTTGTAGSCNPSTMVIISPAKGNANVWVPITGPDGNIMAEIYANGNNLDTVVSSFYRNTGAIRTTAGKKYLDRNMTITPKVQPGSAVKLRLYISKTEFDDLNNDAASGISALTDLRILKNNDPCGSNVSSNTTVLTPDFWDPHGANAYVLQFNNLTGFSSFYFGASGISTLPVNLITFKGTLQENHTLLQWQTSAESNSSHFAVERSIDGINFSAIASVTAAGSSTGTRSYSYIDREVATLPATVIYYRLRMVDIDSKYDYSNIVTVSLADMTDRIKFAPNPVMDEARATVTAFAEGNAQWRIFDNTGRMVMQGNIVLHRGKNIVPVSLSNLSAGTYYFNLKGGDIDQKIKFQKL